MTSLNIFFLQIFFLVFRFKGGEERTVEFMERQGRASSVIPLLEHSSQRGTVKHPFPVNYFLKPWKLGQWFYRVVKIGIVQYVCFFPEIIFFPSSQGAKFPFPFM